MVKNYLNCDSSATCERSSVTDDSGVTCKCPDGTVDVNKDGSVCGQLYIVTHIVMIVYYRTTAHIKALVSADMRNLSVRLYASQ